LRQKNSKWQHAKLLETDMLISSFGTDEKGEIYVLDFSSGNAYQLGF